jgi:hypothetical protein
MRLASPNSSPPLVLVRVIRLCAALSQLTISPWIVSFSGAFAQSSSAFGRPAGQQQSAFGAFGSATPPPAQAPAFGAFGAPAAAPSTTSAFGGTGAFGVRPAGAFGAAPAAQPTTSIFGASSAPGEFMLQSPNYPYLTRLSSSPGDGDRCRPVLALSRERYGRRRLSTGHAALPDYHGDACLSKLFPRGMSSHPCPWPISSCI